GRTTTNTLPVIQASWTYQWREAQDIYLLDGDHFAEVQKVLEQVYGKPDAALGSQAEVPLGTGRALTYSPQQCGVVLNITAINPGFESAQTFVTVMGRLKQ